MIEQIQAKNGQPILRQSGCLLASRFDPVGEAQAWVEKRRAFLTSVKGVFVLGLGSAYHVRELCKVTSASIVVIERFSEIKELLTNPLAPQAQIVNLAQSRELRAQAEVRALVKESFVVLNHAPSLAQAPDFYRECQEQLNGRDWGSLNWQWNLKNLAALDNHPRVEKSGEPLTIYDLEQTELVQDSQERERMLLKALRELVK